MFHLSYWSKVSSDHRNNMKTEKSLLIYIFWIKSFPFPKKLDSMQQYNIIWSSESEPFPCWKAMFAYQYISHLIHLFLLGICFTLLILTSWLEEKTIKSTVSVNLKWAFNVPRHSHHIPYITHSPILLDNSFKPFLSS